MESMYDSVDASLLIDMDELGVHPLNWIDVDNSIDDYFGKEKSVDVTIYSAEIQTINSGKKLTTDDDDSSMSNDDESDDYDIDPETGEKIFRQAAFISSSISLSPSNNKWIEEYLTNIESSSCSSTSNQILPATTTAAAAASNTSEFLLENIPFSLFENTNEQIDSDWLANIINLDETSDSIMFTDPIIANPLFDNNDNKSSPITTLSSTVYAPLSNENQHESILFNSFTGATDDEYSASSSSITSHRHHRLYSSSSNSELTLVETKLEKVEPDDNSMSGMMMRRASIRSNNQGQQDEDALNRLNIPLSVNDITQSSTEEYNRHLVRLSHLSAEQMHVIKDIRRRGKNKIAAQNCRKRKATSVESLLENVDELKRVKLELEERKRAFQQQIEETRRQYEYLHRQVLPDRQLPPAISVK